MSSTLVAQPVDEERARRQRRRLLGAAATALAAFLALALLPSVGGLALAQFTLDDAYITFRYSEHLAGGEGPVWNLTGDRVEGYTSFLWMALLAGPIALDIPAEVAAKVLAFAAAGGILSIFALYGPKRAPLLRVVAMAGIALSPAFVLITAQGMETALAALLATAAAVLFLEALRERSARAFAGYFVAGLLAILTRPDLAAFWAVTAAGLAAILVLERDRRALRAFATWFVLAFLVPGAVYFAWRWSFYGEPLPNPFYIKGTSGLISPEGVRGVRGFLLNVAAPYLVLLVALLARLLWLRRPAERGGESGPVWSPELLGLGVLFAGLVSFLVAGMHFAPIQGFLWRYQMPIYPVLLLLVILAGAHQPSSVSAGTPARAAALAAGALLVLFPLHTLSEARAEVSQRWQHDREVVGKVLAPFGRDGLSMVVDQSGAVPLYSGWQATDVLGLNDERIARTGLTPAYLRSLDPDLVMFLFHTDKPWSSWSAGHRAMFDFLRRERYLFATAIVKTDERLRPVRRPQVHFYFVKRSSARAARVVRALRGASALRRIPARQATSLLERLP